ncbi:protein phosphatase 4 regulatory subunit 1 [Reticulomyxa filosa]|uniref:Protein phosphatase 4 regulatory subunit 1 n=1 Tax=Reticulomyxa filosa TaxID=46433 RepID=X6NHM2_RETFI|nr:protein phosphatase 4 regulatory subunit 1 [Reticulomyxa filosa]|eukprot:ETO25249.1 protein phosphatase 4 regulatory subunit 1 [Reticulomyxa filosa]
MLKSSRWVRNGAYEQLGPFISTLRSDQVSTQFLKYYTNIPNLSSAEVDADCVNHCAFNFPGVALALGKERWEELNETYNTLVRKSFKSRKTLACSVHEICSILGTELTEKYLMPAIEFFLKDVDDVSIRGSILSNFSKILRVFGDQKREEHLNTLWQLASESDVNWRFRCLLAELSPMKTIIVATQHYLRCFVVVCEQTIG